MDSGPRNSLPFLVDLPLQLEVYKLSYNSLLAWILLRITYFGKYKIMQIIDYISF